MTLTIIIILFLTGAYLLPTLIALVRRHRNWLPIMIVNLLLGWIVIGWIVAFVWSFTADTLPPRRYRSR